MNLTRFAALVCIVVIPISAMTTMLILPVGAIHTFPIQNGPFLDSIEFRLIEGDDQMIQSLLDNEIDLCGDTIDPIHLPTLEEASNIEIEQVLRNGYGYIAINCDKNPFNYTAFRRAAAFALDKQLVADEVWDYLARPLDSCIPRQNPFSCEGQLPYTYYSADIDTGNQLLDDAGFTIDEVTGYRLDPHGNPFSVTVECAQSSNIAIACGEIFAAGLRALYINAESVPTDFYEYLNRLYYHGDFDAVFLGRSVDAIDVSWLAYECRSYYHDDFGYYNFPNWGNSTFDSWREQLLHSISFDDVYEAAIEMQKIWVYECPEIILYQNELISAYRTDRFEGFVNDHQDGVPDFWTYYRAHLKESTFGGNLRVSRSTEVLLNFMVSVSCYCDRLTEEIWDNLIRRDSDGYELPWLVESYIVETHADNPVVPEGYTRFTFDLVHNATWTDGTPLTAEDVAYSLNYYRDSSGNPYGHDLTEMTAAYAPTTYRVIIEFAAESYWHTETLISKPILPKHVFSEIGIDGWNMWNPNPPYEPMVTSGPFNVSERVPGEYTIISWNPNYYYSPDRTETYTSTSPVTSSTISSISSSTSSSISTTTTGEPTTTTTTTTTTTEASTSSWFSQYMTAIGPAIIAGSLVVIVVVGGLIIREIRKR
ncbi:MAG: ABC transporter substrate-binding protein [Candidatus Thorarchaeota archaeon]